MQTNIVNKTRRERGAVREIFDLEKNEALLKVYIKSNLKIYDVEPVGKAMLDREEFCAARFTFCVLKEGELSFNQGDAVSVKFDATGIFYGYVFSKSRDKNGLIEVVCYDQLRYLKNRRTYSEGRMTLDEKVRKIAADCNMKVGECDKSSVLLNASAAENVSLLDVVRRACDETEKMSGERFMLYDDGGYLVLKNEKNMVAEFEIDDETAENFVYKDTIDKDVYNVIEIYSDDKKNNTRYLTTVSDEGNTEKWGMLILTKKATAEGSEYAEAKNLLEKYNRINRSIKIKNVPGNVNYRPGTSVFANMEMGDLKLCGYMRIKRAVHIFENNRYGTDIYLDGSEAR